MSKSTNKILTSIAADIIKNCDSLSWESRRKHNNTTSVLNTNILQHQYIIVFSFNSYWSRCFSYKHIKQTECFPVQSKQWKEVLNRTARKLIRFMYHRHVFTATAFVTLSLLLLMHVQFRDICINRPAISSVDIKSIYVDDGPLLPSSSPSLVWIPFVPGWSLHVQV